MSFAPSTPLAADLRATPIGIYYGHRLDKKEVNNIPSAILTKCKALTSRGFNKNHYKRAAELDESYIETLLKERSFQLENSGKLSDFDVNL